jgi:hypothetical protein
LYDTLVANETLATPDPVLSECASLVKQAIALYAIHRGYPELNTHISDGAVTQAQPAHASTLSQWAYRTAQWNLIISAEKALDVAIAYIVDNDITWNGGENYQTDWFANSVEFQKYARINGHRAFVALHPYISRAQQYLGQDLGCDMVADIKTNISNGDYGTLLGSVKRYIAHRTLITAIPYLLTYVEGNSLVFISSADGVTDGYGVYSKPNQEAIRMLLDQLRNDLAMDLAAILHELQSKPTVFTLYATKMETYIPADMVYTSRDCMDNVIGGVLIG